MQDAPKAVWSIPYVSVAFFPSLKQNFIAYRSSKHPDCIFEIHQLWQSGFSRVYFHNVSADMSSDLLQLFVELGNLHGTSNYVLYWIHGGRLFWFR